MSIYYLLFSAGEFTPALTYGIMCHLIKISKEIKMRRIRFFWVIIKRCHFDKFLYVFIISFFVCSLIVQLTEPGIKNYGDAMWYLFVSCTTIGFGDIISDTILGRLITVYLTVYEIVLVALLSGVVISHYIEVIHRREQMTASMFLDKLEHLTELDYDELFEIQEKAKALARKAAKGKA